MRVLWLFFASTVTTKALGASVDERAILLELYEATGGHAWNENFGWAENEFDICSWHGVICDGDDLEHAARRTKENSDGVVLGLKLDKRLNKKLHRKYDRYLDRDLDRKSNRTHVTL